MKKEEGFRTIMRRFLKGDENMIRDVMWALKHNSSAGRGLQFHHGTDGIYVMGFGFLRWKA